jgi:hypothetical protein
MGEFEMEKALGINWSRRDFSGLSVANNSSAELDQ